MDFLDETGTRYQLTETSEAPAPAKKPVWPWVVGGLALVGGLVWMASSPRKANPIEPELKALIKKAKDPKTSFKQLGKLQEHPKVEVRRALLDNPNVCPTDEEGTLTTSLLEKLACEFPEEVTGHPLFVLHALVEPDEAMRRVTIKVVGRTKEVGLIETLLRSWGPDDWYVRRAVAQNPNTPLDTLRLLGNEATEPDWEVREAVARNPSTPLDTLRILGNKATESWWNVRAAVAENQSTPLDTLRTLGNEATESAWAVREAVARNPNTPLDTLRLLGNKATESEGWVRLTVASNPTTPPDVLRLLGNKKTEPVGTVRKAVAMNPHTPEDTLQRMSNAQTEPDEDVREAAMKALADRGLM